MTGAQKAFQSWRGQEHFISILSMQRHRANVKISPKPKVGGEAAPRPPPSPRQRCSFVFSCVGLSPHNLGQSPHNLSEKHGRSFLYSWWGDCPTNFQFCPTNFVLCPTKLCQIGSFSGLKTNIFHCRLAKLSDSKTFWHLNSCLPWFSKESSISSRGILPHQLFPKSSTHGEKVCQTRGEIGNSRILMILLSILNRFSLNLLCEATPLPPGSAFLSIEQ